MHQPPAQSPPPLTSRKEWSDYVRLATLLAKFKQELMEMEKDWQAQQKSIHGRVLAGAEIENSGSVV